MDKRHLAIQFLDVDCVSFSCSLCLCWRLEVIFVWIFLLNLRPPVRFLFPFVVPEVNIEYCFLRVDRLLGWLPRDPKKDYSRVLRVPADKRGVFQSSRLRYRDVLIVK